ncbi:MAG: hypothetical protein ACR2HJ_11650 [Fimbriimonadales bacterium]
MKPRGKGFQRGHDPRRNTAGQRNAEAVARAAQARELYVKVLNETVGKAPPKVMTRLEMVIRQQVQLAMQGDHHAREMMLDRIWGKAAQPLTGADDGPIRTVDVTLNLGNDSPLN